MNENFGIEIEFTGIARGNAANILANCLNSTGKQTAHEYRYEVLDYKGRVWTITRDRSIRPEGQSIHSINSTEFMVELISPVLTKSDLTLLDYILNAMKFAGAKVNETCGIHIHLDVDGHTPQSLVTLVNLVYNNTDVIYDMLKIPVYRLKYCRKFSRVLVEKLNSQEFLTLETLKDIWYSIYPKDKREIKQNRTRYYGVNLHSAFHKNTVEFRYFNSSLDLKDIQNYVDFCLNLNEYAKNNNDSEVSITKFVNPEKELLLSSVI